VGHGGCGELKAGTDIAVAPRPGLNFIAAQNGKSGGIIHAREQPILSFDYLLNFPVACNSVHSLYCLK
jgi:hypothetical protein